MSNRWESISGHMYNQECEFLSNLAKGLTVFEIGTHHGKSTSALASSANHVTTIDTYEGDWNIKAPNRANTERNLSVFTNITLLVGRWQEQEIILTKYDMLFYDGCHSEESEFLSTLKDYKGVIALHDYKPNELAMSHVVESVNKYSTETNRPLLKGSGSLCWFNKIG